MSHADDLQAVSVDEALIEVTSGVEQVRTQAAGCDAEGGTSTDPVKEFAEMIRDQVRRATGCEGVCSSM
jgi:DNA repair protein REV1